MNQTMEQVRVDSEILEEMVDRDGIATVLDMLSAICYEKAEHLTSNWGESLRSVAVRCWTSAGSKISRIAEALRE